VLILSNQLEEIRKHVDKLSEEQVRDYLTKVLSSIQEIWFRGYTEDKVLRDMQSVYFDIVVRPVKDKMWSKIQRHL
jgi:hypothetical protein